MGKASGLGMRFAFGGYDVSGDTNSLGKISGGPATFDFTDITESAFERGGGLRDGSVSWVSYWNPGASANAAHNVLSPLTLNDAILTGALGTAIGNPSFNLVSKQLNYDGTRAVGGAYTFAVDAVANGFGLEWGNLLTPWIRTDAAATNGTANDFTAVSTAFGWQAYLAVTAFTGTDATVKIQDSADNASFADVAGGSFAQITSGTPQAQRLAVGGTATVRRYVRAATVTTGGFASLSFAVTFVRNTVAVSF